MLPMWMQVEERQAASVLWNAEGLIVHISKGLLRQLRQNTCQKLLPKILIAPQHYIQLLIMC